MRDINNSIGSILGNIKFTPVAQAPVYKEDGVDHINISYSAATELGKFLSTRFRTPFIHPTFGEFESVEGLWQYLTREIDEETTQAVRSFYGNRNARHMSKLAKRNVDNFKDIIFEVMANKIYTNSSFAKMLAENELPLLMYYVDTKGARVNVPFANWYIKQINQIKEQAILDKPWEDVQEQLALEEPLETQSVDEDENTDVTDSQMDTGTV